jgi:hypothetical protein
MDKKIDPYIIVGAKGEIWSWCVTWFCAGDKQIW